jgi:hypothetical protein
VVKLLPLAAIAGLVVFATACGSDDNPTPSTGGQPSSTRPPATRSASGPSATADPTRGRPGTEVVITGDGWTPGATITISGASGGSTGQPYATTTATNNGSFTARFRLDRSASGGDLPPGRVNLIAASASATVTVPFEVLPPAPGGSVGGGGSGGG